VIELNRTRLVVQNLSDGKRWSIRFCTVNLDHVPTDIRPGPERAAEQPFDRRHRPHEPPLLFLPQVVDEARDVAARARQAAPVDQLWLGLERYWTKREDAADATQVR
jgi:hypothetical protein